MKRINVLVKCIVLITAFLSSKHLHAQLSPFGAMYYQNQYINNPAYAGIEAGLVLDGGIRMQDSNMPGAPKTQFLTARYAMSDKAGIGLNLNTEQVGLIKKVRTVASYAYHLPLSSENNTISFGLSLGFMDQMIDQNLLSGEHNDSYLNDFNQRETYVDGDFGMLYRYKNLSVEGAVLNINHYIRDKEDQRTVANVAKFYFASSYKINLSAKHAGTIIEPKLAYRVVDGFKDIIDFGTNLHLLDQKLNLFGVYHSSQSTTLGLGVRLIENLYTNVMYTTATAVLASESRGSFEINLKYKILNKKKTM